MLRNVTRESEADFRKRPCGKQPREDERSEVKFGFGSKVRGHRPETQRKTAAKQFAGGFLLRNVTRESEADFRKRPCGKQPREDERSDVKFGFGSKVRGRKTGLAKEKPPQSNLLAVFPWRESHTRRAGQILNTSKARTVDSKTRKQTTATPRPWHGGNPESCSSPRA